MFTAIRSVMMFDKVEVREDGHMAFIDMVTDPVYVPSRPGFIQTSMILGVEVDGKASSGKIEVRYGSFLHTALLTCPEGHRLVGAELVLLVPVEEEGFLRVTVVDDNPRAKPLKTKWGVVFEKDAQVLAPGAGADIVATATDHMRKLEDSYASRTAVRH